MKHTAAHLVLSLASLSSTLLAQKVQVQVSGGTGDEILTRSITISGGGKTIDAPQNTRFELPYGTYTIDVSASGMKESAFPIEIDQPAEIVTVALGLGSYEGPDPPP